MGRPLGCLECTSHVYTKVLLHPPDGQGRPALAKARPSRETESTLFRFLLSGARSASSRVFLVFCFYPIRQYHSGVRFIPQKKPAGTIVSQSTPGQDIELAAIHRYNMWPTAPPESQVPVPQVFVLCEDRDIIGTPSTSWSFSGVLLYLY